MRQILGIRVIHFGLLIAVNAILMGITFSGFRPKEQITRSSLPVGSIAVNIQNFRNSNGIAQVALFQNSKGFPSDLTNALQVKQSTIRNGIVNITFTNLPYGEYAISVWHDENKNNKFDNKGIGLSKEAIGTSNNAKSTFGLPRFEDAKFQVNTNSILLKIKM